jgi:sulfur transfer complex TusBCD TusB component (DsrH family)
MIYSKRFRYIIVIAVLSTFLIIGSATARTITSYNTAYAAGVNASSSATLPTNQINPYTSAKVLLQDGISALQQDNDTSKALTHLKLAYQQLTSIGENSSMVEPTKILLQDGISALQQDNDVSKTLVYMKLAYQQLSAPSNAASLPSSASPQLAAVVDTFLVYKIAERCYNRNVAVIASVLFAVMPSLLYSRWILLDNILMPLFLSSILFALYHRKKDYSKHDKYGDGDGSSDNKTLIPILYN